MLLKLAKWSDVERMPAFERSYYYQAAVEIYRDKKTGEIKIPG